MSVDMELVCDGLQFPTSVAFDTCGHAYVAESGLDARGRPGKGRILRVDASGHSTPVCEDLGAPLNGLTRAGERFLVAEGGAPGRLLGLSFDGGTLEVIVDGLPGGGSYHTNMVAVGPEGRLYFGQGAATNSGVIDVGAVRRAETRQLPSDIVGMDVVLHGVGYESEPVTPVDGDTGCVLTGGLSEFGKCPTEGTRLEARLPCTAAVLSCEPDGSDLKLVAWGLRNAYGLGFLPDGRLLALELGPNDCGPRPIGAAPSCLYAVEEGAWYGWPDYVAGVPVDSPRYAPKRGERPQRLLANADTLPEPPAPLLRFPLHSAPVKFALHPGPGPRAGQLFVALFGDKRPFTAPPGPAAGRAVARVELPSSGSPEARLHPFASSNLHRPIDLAFHPSDGSLWILDFGDYEVRADASTSAIASTGRLWRVGQEWVNGKSLL